MLQSGKYFIGLIVTGLINSSLLNPALADAGACNATDIVNGIQQSIERIEDYRLDSSAIIDDRPVTARISGKSPNLMRIDMTITQGNTAIRTGSVFDGTYQWIETVYPSGTQVSKIELAKITRKDRPFDTSYYLMGSGLLNGEDYPASVAILVSVYDLSPTACTPDRIEMSGHLNIERFRQYAGTKTFSANPENQVQQFANHFRLGHFVFNAKTLALMEYQLGTRERPDFFSARFDQIDFNKGLTVEDFAYQPPQGAQVEDITQVLLERHQPRQ